jgi:hypothetical protein
MDPIPADRIDEAEQAIRDRLDRLGDGVRKRIVEGKKLGEDDRQQISSLAEAALRECGLNDGDGGGDRDGEAG